jgi:hypothetical protein
MDIVCVDKCLYEIQEQKEVPVRYTGMNRPISSIGWHWNLTTVMICHADRGRAKKVAILRASL